MKNDTGFPRGEPKPKPFEELTFHDGFMFGIVMQDRGLHARVAGGYRIRCRKQKCRRPAPGADRRHIPQGRAFTARPGCVYTRKSLTVLKPLFRSLPCVVLLLSLGKDTLVSCIVKLLLELGNLCLDVLGTECTELKGLSVLFKEVHAGRIGSINA